MVNVAFAVSLLAALVVQVSSLSARDSSLSLWARDLSPSEVPALCRTETTCLPFIDAFNACDAVPGCYCTQANMQAAQACGNCALTAVPTAVERGYVQVIFNYLSDYCLAAGYVLTPPSITVGGIVVAGSATATPGGAPPTLTTAAGTATLPASTAPTAPAATTPVALNPFKISGASSMLPSTTSAWRMLVTAVGIVLLARMA